ncbi:hypothetical protein ACEPAF_3788 [Sanghuangporus sanghuang]
MSYKLKLTSPSGETRRLTFNVRPSWLDLEQRIASLFGIQNKAIAVSYEDSDGDIITMSSQDELDDYFQTSYKHDGVAKFLVVHKSQGQHSARKNTSAFVEGFEEAPDGGLPTMGPTMFFEVDDGDWQRLPRIPELFGVEEEDSRVDPSEGHAFVEVVDSDAEASKKGSSHTSSQHTPMSTRQLRHKGKEKATVDNEATDSTSAASIVDDEAPIKPSIHVYDAGRSPSVSTQGKYFPEGARPSGRLGMGSFGTVYPANPPQDAFKQIPRATVFLDSESRDHENPASVHSESARPAQQMTGEAPSLDLESAELAADETSGSRTPRLEQTSVNQPHFVHDVASLVDNLTNAFASHPELSEGLRNIIRNAVGGRYWDTERDRIAGIAENVRVAAEETSTRITEAAGNMASNAERDAVRTISEALGGVFRVIGEISGTGAAHPSTEHPTWTAPPGPAAPASAPLHHHERSRYPSGWNEPSRSHDIRHGRRDPYHHASHHGPGYGLTYRPAELGTGGSRSWQPAQAGPQVQRSNTWGPGSLAAQYYAGPPNADAYDVTDRPNLHETKVQLEAAKAIYKAEKERFRQEKEERRKQRREFAEKKSSRIQRPDGTMREEEIIARIPFHPPAREVSSTHSHPKDFRAPPHVSSMSTSVPSSAQPAQTAPTSTSQRSAAGASMYSSIDPIPVVPPPPIPAPMDPTSSISVVPPIPPPPPPPSVPTSNFAPSAPIGNSAEQNRSSLAPMQPNRSASGSGPYSWPVPPARDPLRRRHLTTLRERIQARLFDMGITPSSQPDMMDILNACANRTDAPDDDEVLADVLAAMNIRGSPSPRVGGSGLPH